MNSNKECVESETTTKCAWGIKPANAGSSALRTLAVDACINFIMVLYNGLMAIYFRNAQMYLTPLFSKPEEFPNKLIGIRLREFLIGKEASSNAGVMYG